MIWIVVELFVRLAIGGLLVLAGIAKFSTTAAWRVDWLDSYKLLPRPFLLPMAWLMPLTEVVVGVMLALGAFGRAGAIAAIATLGMVTAAVVIALIRGQEVSCGCLGKVGTLISWPVVVRNMVLVAALVVVALRGVSGPSITEFGPAVQVVVIAAITAALSLIAHRRRPPESAADPLAAPQTEPAGLPFPHPPASQEAHS
ncbi:MauE/DoxX family redox-associated membrane protein [Nocardia amikacinitolerans]|uniref:MauE/DoxX family redox-associated membrane protein n=1 Tax=Nocardia amikacinitolerans TaxID=756689 RepID=UPI0020A4EC08|nr:MauE/DoxX family redox-associated membrane protein [Nocardia amikacinitolerans]MCP2279718.1 Methylamine utilization protein MauE [Nocardia amikacinitolerans]